MRDDHLSVAGQCDPDCDGHRYDNAFANANCFGYAYTNAYDHADANLYGNAHRCVHRDASANTHQHPHGDANADCFANTEGGDVTLTGLVYHGANGAQHPISNAIVAVTVCVPHSFPATAGPDGRYALFLPAAYLHGCEQVTLSAQARGYRPFSQTVATADLHTAPQRDIGLVPQMRKWLPLIMR